MYIYLSIWNLCKICTCHLRLVVCVTLWIEEFAAELESLANRRPAVQGLRTGCWSAMLTGHDLSHQLAEQSPQRGHSFLLKDSWSWLFLPLEPFVWQRIMKEHSLLGNLAVYNMTLWTHSTTRLHWCCGLANMKQLRNMFNSAAEKLLRECMVDGDLITLHRAKQKSFNLYSYQFVPLFDDLRFGLLHDICLDCCRIPCPCNMNLI